MTTRLAAITLALLAAALIVAPDALAKGWTLEDYLAQKPKSDWDGFGVGSMIHNKMTQNVLMPGAPEPQVQTTETKKTLTEITETEYVIKVETKGVGDWVVSEERKKKTKAKKSTVEDLGKEKVKVGETEYECAKKKVTWKEEGKDEEVEFLWIHAEKGILKMEKTGQRAGTLTVTKLDHTKKIGETEVTGRELALDMAGPMGMKLTGTAFLSMSVPENIVAHTIGGSQGPMQLKLVLETIAFIKK